MSQQQPIEKKPKISYMLQRLPSFFQTEMFSERENQFNYLMTIFNDVVLNQNFKKIRRLDDALEFFRILYGFTKEEKQKLFLLLLHLIGQPYFYSTQNGVRRCNYQTKQQFFYIDFPYIIGFLQKISYACSQKDLEVDWHHIFKMMNQVFLENNFSLFSDSNSDKKIFFKKYLDFVQCVVPFFNDSSLHEVFQESLEKSHSLGQFLRGKFLRISHRVPEQTYWQLVERIIFLWEQRQFLQYEQIFMIILGRILVRFPLLPWYKYYDFIFLRLFRDLIQILPLPDSLYGFQTQLQVRDWCTMSLSIPKQIGPMLANLLLPSNDPQFDVIWGHIQKIFGIMRGLLHPNNQQSATQNVLYVYFYFINQYLYRYTRECREIKRKKIETEEDKMEELGLKELQEECKVQALEDELNSKQEDGDDGSVQDEEERESEEEEEEIPTQAVRVCFTDPKLIQKVLDLYTRELQHLIYLKEYKDKMIEKIIRSLVQLSPEVVPNVIQQIEKAFARQDMKYSTIIGVLTSIMPTLLDSKQCPEGLNYLLTLIRALSEQIGAHDMNKSYSIWRMIDLILQFIPVYSVDDLKKAYPNLDELMEQRVQDVTEEISSVVIDAFKKYLSIFEFMVQNKRETIKQTKTLFISISNKFYNLVAQSSRSVFRELVDQTAEYFQDRLQPNVQQQFAQLLQAFMVRDPNYTLEVFMQLLGERLLKPVSSNYKAKHFIQLPNKMEFQVSHQETLLYYLGLIENLIGFGHYHCKKWDDMISNTITLCLQHAENPVFTQGVRILQQLLLGLVSIHPTDVGFRDESDKLDPKWDQYAHKSFKENFSVKWFEPSLEDRNYLVSILQRFYYPLVDYLKSQIKTEVGDLSEYIKNNFLKIVGMINEPQCTELMRYDTNARHELSRAIICVSEVYQVILIRSRQVAQSELFKKFQDWIVFPELDQEYDRIQSLVTGFFIEFIEGGLSGIQRVSNSYFHLFTRQLGCYSKDDFNNQLINTRKWISGRVSLFTTYNKGFKSVWLSRFMRVITAAQYLNTRVLALSFQQNKIEVVNGYILLTLAFSQQTSLNAVKYLKSLYFENNELLRELAGYTFDTLRKLVDPNDQKSIFGKQSFIGLPESTIQKYAHYQKVIVTVIPKLMEVFVAKGDFTSQLLELFSYLNDAYSQLIDKTFKISYNLTIVNLQEIISSIFQLNSITSQNEQVSFIKILNPQLQSEYDSFFKDYQLVQKDKQNFEDQRSQFLQKALQIFNQDTHVRNKIIMGLTVLILPPLSVDYNRLHFYQLEEQWIRVLLDSCIHHEFALRSFGRVSLLRIIRCARFLNLEKKQHTLQLEDFKQKSFEEYYNNRFLRQEELQSFQVKSNSKQGAYTYYTSFISKQVSVENLRKQLAIMLEFFNDIEKCKKFIELIQVDLGTRSDDQPNQMFLSSNVFHDIARHFNKINTNLKVDNVIFKNYSVPFEYLKRLFKRLFQITEFKFFELTNEQISELAQQHHDKDSQTLVYLYVMGLLKSLHSGENIRNAHNSVRNDIIDWALKILNAGVENLSKEAFMSIKVGLMMVSFTCDPRTLQHLISRLIEYTENSKSVVQYLRYLGMLSMVHQHCGVRGVIYSQQVFQVIQKKLDTISDPREFASITSFIVSMAKEQLLVPHNPQLIQDLFQVKLPENWQSIELTTKQIIVYEPPQILILLCNKINQLLREEQQSRKIVLDSIVYVVDLVRYDQIRPHVLEYFGGILQWLLEFKEEDIGNESVAHTLQELSLQISQFIYDAETFKIVLNWVRGACNSSFYKTRMRALRFLKYFLYNNIKDDREKYIEEFSYLLLDEQKIVQTQAYTLVSMLASTLLDAQLEKLVNYFISCTTKKDTGSSIGKAGLVAILRAQSNITTQWTNRALKAVLIGSRKAPAELRGQIKDFAAHFQKLHKQNYLSEELEYPLDPESLELLTEFASPYNYFA